MGEVYRARDAKLQRDVALKLLSAAVVDDPDRLARFRREAQVLASLNHPNIAAIYGFEDSGATHALVLELVEGQTPRRHGEGARLRSREGDRAGGQLERECHQLPDLREPRDDPGRDDPRHGGVHGARVWTLSPDGKAKPFRVTRFNEIAARFSPAREGAPSHPTAAAS